MKNINEIRLLKSLNKGYLIILTASVVLVYLLVSIYFANHFFFNTVINGVKVSLRAYEDTDDLIRSYVRDYRMRLIERNGVTEEILGQNIGLKYNEKNSISEIYHSRNAFEWIFSLFKEQEYYIDDLFVYDKEKFDNKIDGLNCLNKVVTEPENVNFKYINGSYEAAKEVYGNRINRGRLYKVVSEGISLGKRKINLDEGLCYDNPRYTLDSEKTQETLKLLNKYVSSKITYIFGGENEVIDGNIINKWLSVDENLEAVINEIEIMRYVRSLSRKYDTVGITRNFKTSIGKTVKVEGGLYGWKIDRAAESKALLENIKKGEELYKEPIYAQKALYRGEDEIGGTYVEINITRQYLWFYKDGKLLTEGPVITGDPNKGNSTALGAYMLNYKEKNVVLRGPDYETEITYWMPFFGNMGIHEAYWRNSFGGEIYRGYGTHGCVNTPTYVAKIIFENIEEGTPIICYEEETM